MVLVTGPNMSGKSTYLRQVALIAIMAHIGCFVPAHFASFRVVDHIFTRICLDYSIESNSSTFMLEMRETAFILQNVTPRSLVLLDELGQATSSVDGLAIAWSCCEFLLSLKAYTIFATHMQRLVELSSLYPNVKTCHFHVEIINNRLDFKFFLKEGHANVPHYGLLLSEVSGFPSEVVEQAKEITKKLSEEEAARIRTGYCATSYLRKEYHIAQRLLCLKYANLSEENIRSYLQNLKDSYKEENVVNCC